MRVREAAAAARTFMPHAPHTPRGAIAHGAFPDQTPPAHRALFTVGLAGRQTRQTDRQTDRQTGRQAGTCHAHAPTLVLVFYFVTISTVGVLPFLNIETLAFKVD